MKLQKYLNLKPLYYKEIDYNRFPNIYENIKDCFSNKKIIHIVGTNGKGTTGRFLASALNSLGYSVGHYTSPHILEFNERIWIDGANVTDETLDIAHEKLQTILSKSEAEALSYFEYTTLLAMIVFSSCDYIVLEAGLGGEYDATAVFDKMLTLVTPIDFDHEAFLGNDIKSIAKTKLNAIQNKAIISNQKHKEIFEVVEKVRTSNNIIYHKIDEILDESDLVKIGSISKTLDLPIYLKNNLSLAISALNVLNIKYNENDFNNSKLFGRLSKFKSNILLDVGHNTLAAESISKALFPKKYHLIYNTYADKNYKNILYILKPVISVIEIIDVDEERILDKEKLLDVTKELDIDVKDFDKIDDSKEYLVFGSFSVVEAFLKRVDSE